MEFEFKHSNVVLLLQPGDAASAGHLVNSPVGVRSSRGSTTAENANLDAEPTNLDVD